MAVLYKNHGGSTQSPDRSAVHASQVASGGYAAGSQSAYSLGSCAMGQTDVGLRWSKMLPQKGGNNNSLTRIFTAQKRVDIGSLYADDISFGKAPVNTRRFGGDGPAWTGQQENGNTNNGLERRQNRRRRLQLNAVDDQITRAMISHAVYLQSHVCCW